MNAPTSINRAFPAEAPQKSSRRPSARSTRALLEQSLDRLLTAAEAVVADLDALDGDPDFELECEDEGAQCEDEGFDSDREPDHGHEQCAWPDEGDQTFLVRR